MARREREREAAIAAGAGAAVGGVVAAEIGRSDHVRRAMAGHAIPRELAGVSASERARMKAAAGRLDAGTQARLRQYTDYDNKAINKHLRTGEVTQLAVGKADGLAGKLGYSEIKLRPVGGVAGAKLKTRYDITARALDRALKSDTLPNNLTVFRGTGTRHVGELRAGRSITDAGVTSTSTSHKQAERFRTQASSSRGKSAMLVIDAGGAKGMSLAPVSRFASEKEIAFAPKTTVHIDHVAKGVRRHIFDAKHDVAFGRIDGVDKKAAPKIPADAGKAVTRTGQALAVLAPAVAAATAYDQTRQAGGSTGEAAAAAGGAGVVAAGAGYAVAKGLGAGVRALTAAAPMLGKVAARAVPGLGLALMAYGALEGYRKGGDLKSAALGAIGADHFIEPKSRPRAYLNDSAAAKAMRPAAAAPAAGAGRAAAVPPRSDGTTAGYQRVDPRSGSVVTVKSYSTPDRP